MVISVICFPLSYKLSTGVSFMKVLKRTSKAFRILLLTQQEDFIHVGFDFWFWNVNIKVFW